MRTPRFAVLAVLLALLASAPAAVAAPHPDGSPDGSSLQPAVDAPRPATLRLGGVFPLTGPMGAAGTAMLQGIQAVLTEVNAAGGVEGTKLELVVGDDRYDPTLGKSLIRRQIERDGVFAFAGIFSPFTIRAGLPLIRAARVPVVSPGGNDDREFDESMLFPVTSPCGRQMAGNVQHLVQDLEVRKLAVVSVDADAVSSCTEQMTAVAKTLGAEVVFSGVTAPGALDCAGRVLAARASGAQALVVLADNLGTVRCLQARVQQNWDVPVSIAYNNTDDPTILRTLGPTAEGLLSSSPFTGMASTQFAEQCGAIEEYYPDATVSFHSLVGCLGAKLLVAGIRAAGADRAGLVRALESGHRFDFGGLVPALSYGPGKRLPYDLTATVQVRGGNWVRTGPLYTPIRPAPMSRRLAGVLAAALTAGLPIVTAGPAAAAGAQCATSTSPRLGAVPNAGTATARGMFVTYDDWDTVLEGGTLIPPDLAAPVAEAAVDRTGLGTALAGQVYSPYNDAVGMLNTSAGTALPAEQIAGPSRAQVSGRPPQDQKLTMGGGCVRLGEGPSAEAATNASSPAPGFGVRVGEVRSFTGPRGAAAEASSSVVLTDVSIGELLIEQVVLQAKALADGAIGASSSSAVISGVTLAGQPYALTGEGVEPVGVRTPESAGLAAFGMEFLSAGTSGLTHSSNISRAWATGPMFKRHDRRRPRADRHPRPGLRHRRARPGLTDPRRPLIRDL